jgi:hypothetical protein
MWAFMTAAVDMRINPGWRSPLQGLPKAGQRMCELLGSQVGGTASTTSSLASIMSNVH